MGYRVKSFREVKQDSISLAAYITLFGPVVYGCYQLGFAGETLFKAMLLVDNDVIFRQVFGHMTEHNVLHYFTTSEVKEIGR